MISEIQNKLIEYRMSSSVNSMDGKEFFLIVHPPDGSLQIELVITHETSLEEFVKMINDEYIRMKKLKVEYYRRLADTLNDDVEMPLI